MVRAVIADVLTAYLVIVFLRVVVSWFPLQSDSPVMPVVRVLCALTEPVLAPIRRLLPAVRAGGSMSFDLSPMIVIIVLIILRQVIA